MKELAQLLNEMQSAGVITNYALFGATAQTQFGRNVGAVRFDCRRTHAQQISDPFVGVTLGD